MSSVDSVLALGVGAGLGLAVLVIVLLGAISIYNGLVRRRVEVKNAWAQIDVQLKRRHSLIPNFVETVKGYAAHEKDTFERVIAARNQAASAAGPAQSAAAENLLGGALRQLFALSEAYPDLKANQNFKQLSEELASTENRIGFARQHYNDCVASYNESIQVFPSVLFAGAFGFRPEEFYEVEDAKEKEVPAVKF